MKSTSKTNLRFQYLFIGLWAIFTTTMWSCQDEIDTDLRSSITEQSVESEEDQLQRKFAEILVQAVEEYSTLRKLIKEEALKQFDKDYDVLYQIIRDKPLDNGLSVHATLSTYASDGELDEIESRLPLLTIFIPDLPDFSAEKWNTGSDVPRVAVRLNSSNTVPIYGTGHAPFEMEPGHIPGFPVLVVKQNERVKVDRSNSASNGTALRVTGTSFFYQRKHLMFIDPSFDGTQPAKNTTNRQVGRNQVDPRNIEAFNAGVNWHRDYVYYGLTPTNPRGPLKNNYSEFITSISFADNIDGRTALNKISDQTGDPRLIGEMVVRPKFWTEGNFEFRVTILINAKNGLGQTLIKTFPVEKDDLFDLTYQKVWVSVGGGIIGRIPIYLLESIETKSYQPNIEILPWDLQNYGIAWKFIVEEVDPDQIITKSFSLNTTYAQNFELNTSIGLFEKVGLNFGASNTRQENETYSIQTQLTSDFLGETVLTFDQPVVTAVSQSSVSIREISTGTMKLTIEPKRVF